MKVDSTWLAQYTRPLQILHVNGLEFVGIEFQELLSSYGIQEIPTTSKKSYSFSILERTDHVIH